MRKLWITATICAVIVATCAPALQFQLEKSRRRHQIGQLWSLICLDYARLHAGRYPDDLARLRSLPRYGTYFERAIHEIELVTPGIDQNTARPNTVVLRERTVDKRGGRWVHYVDGMIEYRAKL